LKVLRLSRAKKNMMLLFFDSILIILILLASFSMRLGYWYFPGEELSWVIFGAPIISTPIFVYFGIYRAVIRHIGSKALWDIVQAVSLYALIWGSVGFITVVWAIPRSVILINWILSLLIIVGFRVVARGWLSDRDVDNKKRVLVYGAGDAGVQLVSALEQSSEYLSVGFVDDDRSLQGRQIRGLTIFSENDIENLIVKLKLDEVLIAMPSASRNRRLAIIEKLGLYPVSVRVLPGVSELAEGKISIGDLREISIKDLLGREIVKPNESLLSKKINNKVVAVTGAGGSIGSELCRQILSLKPKALILYERSELALYNIEKELSKNKIDSIDIIPILGSVNNKKRLSKVFNGFRVNTVYHTAAYKHVPLVEFNNAEGANNNIFGTLNCAQVAIDSRVETFVLISTDKAVRPTNTMGATKRMAELVLQALSVKHSTTKFTMVRFGNVLDSSGSVIPLFKQQIQAGGPLTVTDKEIIRYFMTIPEAVELVIQAGAMGTGGDVFVLDMGKPVRIAELAKKMIRLSGLQVKDELNPSGDIEIQYTGLRPGEKLYEELLIGDNVSETDNPLIMRAQEEMHTWEDLEPILGNLRLAIDTTDLDELRRLLIEVIPGFKPPHRISDLLYKDKL
jgi:FlaA1/EpsC-like NDP-sugar epimerase